jgi:hypothetical protein
VRFEAQAQKALAPNQLTPVTGLRSLPRSGRHTACGLLACGARAPALATVRRAGTAWISALPGESSYQGWTP